MYAFIYTVCVCVCVLYHEPAKAEPISSRPETLMWSCLVYCSRQRLPGGWTTRCWSGASSKPPPDKSILRGNSTSWLPITASLHPTLHFSLAMIASFVRRIAIKSRRNFKSLLLLLIYLFLFLGPGLTRCCSPSVSATRKHGLVIFFLKITWSRLVECVEVKIKHSYISYATTTM